MAPKPARNLTECTENEDATGLQFLADGVWIDARDVQYSERLQAWQLAFGDTPMPEWRNGGRDALIAATSKGSAPRVPSTVDVPKAEPVSSGPIEDAIRTIVEPMVQAAASQLDPESIAKVVDAEVQKRLESLRPKVTAITYRDRPTVELPADSVHHLLPEVLTMVNVGLNPWLVGPAGSGKSTLARNVAEVLELPFSSKGCSADMDATALFGYLDYKGEYVSTEFRRRYENGGVFLLDEIDAAHPGVMTALNDAIANHLASFPDGMVKRHADFIVMVGANTYGKGGDRQYVGRNPLDAATLDRFYFVPMDYDEKLERRIALAHNPVKGAAWHAAILQMRENLRNYKIEAVVSTRALLAGPMLDHKPAREVVDGCILKGMDDTQARKLLEGVDLAAVDAAA